MSTVMHKQSRGVTLRKQHLLVLLILALLTLFVVTYVMFYAVVHVDLWHMVQPMAVQYGH